jgi:hypothetical protein
MLPLINRSDQSYGRSLMKVSDIVEHAEKNGMPVAALTDVHSLSALPDFLLKCSEKGIHGIAGVTILVNDGDKPFAEMVLLAKGNKGYGSLRELVNIAGHTGLDKEYNPSRGIELSDILSGKYAEELSCCVCLDGFSNSIGERLIKRDKIRNDVPSIKQAFSDINTSIAKLKSQFCDGDYLGVKLPNKSSPLAGALSPFDAIDGKKVVSPGAVETSIAYAKDDNTLNMTKQWFKDYATAFLSKQGTDAEVNELINRKFDGLSLSSSGMKYEPSHPPFVGADYLKEKCLTPRIFSKQPTSTPLKGGPEVSSLRKIVEEKWKSYSSDFSPEKKKIYGERIKKELFAISTCGFEDYFTNIYKIKLVEEKNGNALMLRGSAVGSLIMNVIGMTPIDAIEEGLLFRRFIDEERVDEPDVDIEFMNSAIVSRRIESSFEPGQVAKLSADSGISKPSLLMNKARDAMLSFYGLQPEHIAHVLAAHEKLIKEIERPRNRQMVQKKYEDWVREILPLIPKGQIDKSMRKMIEIAGMYDKSAYGSTVSPGSVVFIPDGVGRYFNILPSTAKSKPEIVGSVGRISQSKQNIGSTGHIKYDLLPNHSFGRAKRMARTLDIGDDIKINYNDPTIKFAFSRNAFLGVNQMNGSVGSKLANRFKPKNFQELTALNALIRDGGNKALKVVIDQYLFAKENPDTIILHKVMEPILRETHGSLLYEEQLMTILTDVGDFSWGDADRFRSALKKGKGDIIDEYEAPFIKNAMHIHSVNEATASNWYQPIRDKRGRFVFNKAHAVAYAHVAVLQCILKCKYPAHNAAELYLDANAKFFDANAKSSSKNITLEQSIKDWEKIQNGRPVKANAGDFVKAIAIILKREELDPDSAYKRKPEVVKEELELAIQNGKLDFALPIGKSRVELLELTHAIMNKVADGYHPTVHKMTGEKASTRSPVSNVKRKSKRTAGNGDEETVELEITQETDILPANRRVGENIDWFKKVMVGHVIQFLSEEKIISRLEVNQNHAVYDRFKFTVNDKEGVAHLYHILAISTDPARSKGRTKNYDIVSGMHQGGVLDKARLNSLSLMAEIANLTGMGNLPHFNMEKNKSGGGFKIEKKSMGLVLKSISLFTRKSSSDLHDADSGGILSASRQPAEPTSPMMVDVEDKIFGQKRLKSLFEESRKIDVDGMSVQFEKGHFSIAEVRQDKLVIGEGTKRDSRPRRTEVIANYRKVVPGLPLFETPLIENNTLSKGGHQKFIFDYSKGRASKIDLGFTTRRIRGHTCGHITPGSDSLWLGEAALDMLSFNELQRLVIDLNKRKGLTLPFAEENCVAIRSAGGATDTITKMLGVKVLKKGKDQDFCIVSEKIIVEPFDSESKKPIKEWFESRKIHWLSENTPANVEGRKKLAALMMDVGIPEENLRDFIVSHQMKPDQNFTQSVNNIYDNHLNKEGNSFLHTSNMETWLRGSDIAIETGDDGKFICGYPVKEITEGKPFLSMTKENQIKVANGIRKRFFAMSGAKSLGLALDNDGAGRADAEAVYRFCKQVGIQTGSLMPEERKEVPFMIDGVKKLFDLKDHNDFLMLYKDLVTDGQPFKADDVLKDYASFLKKPKFERTEPRIDMAQSYALQQLKKQA